MPESGLYTFENMAVILNGSVFQREQFVVLAVLLKDGMCPDLEPADGVACSPIFRVRDGQL
jgi:hypothetical protein